VRAVIVVGAEQTEQASYSIPAGYIGLLTGYYFSVNRVTVAAGVDIVATLRVREFGSTVFNVKSTMNIASDVVFGNRLFDPSLVIPSQADVEMRVDTVDADNVDVTGEFDMWLVEDGAL
jgi:hypothetical protein